MEPLSPYDLLAGARSPNHPLWRAAAKAMGRWTPAPKLTDETARVYYRCNALRRRASAKLLDAERTEKREHSSGVSVETAFLHAPRKLLGPPQQARAPMFNSHPSWHPTR